MVVRLYRHRISTVLAVVALSLVFAVPAGAAPTFNRVDAAAGWLARQMVDGEHFEVVFGDQSFPDQGLTIDGVLAFAAARTSDAYAARATAWLARPEILNGYTGGGGSESYAGATAKLALAAEVRGLDPGSFGGVDLLARLRELQAPSGRFTDRSDFGDFSNAFSQSFAILALGRAGGAPAMAATYLAGSQCADGGFPLLFEQPTCTSQADATALAVQALLVAGRPLVAASAVRWLVGIQAADGSFSDAGVPNANSTGLAAQALAVSGQLGAWLEARQFVLGLQVGCAGSATDRGAVAYSAEGFEQTTAVRATAQAVPGLAGAGLASLSAHGARPDAPTLRCAS